MPVTYESHLACILESPADNGPRLVLADWLEEQGDPRGEFIRLSIQFEEWKEDDASKSLSAEGILRHARLTARCRELLAEHEWKWTPECLREMTKCQSCGGDGFWRDSMGRREKHPAGDPCEDCMGKGNHGWAIPRVWRRGFIDDVTVDSIEVWRGKPCPNCIGVTSCRDCCYTGFVGGIGRDVMKCCPITMVRVANKEPHRFNNGYVWGHYGPDPASPELLPNFIWDKLDGVIRPLEESDAHWKWYGSRELADKALADVLKELVRIE